MAVVKGLIEAVEWDRYELMEGDATDFGHALAAFVLDAPVGERRALWSSMENHVFSQDDIYSAAEPTLTVLLASLVGGVEEPAALSILDLVFHIVHAARYRDDDLGARCLGSAREASWFFVFLGKHGSDRQREACLEILDITGPSCAEVLRRFD